MCLQVISFLVYFHILWNLVVPHPEAMVVECCQWERTMNIWIVQRKWNTLCQAAYLSITLDSQLPTQSKLPCTLHITYTLLHNNKSICKANITSPVPSKALLKSALGQFQFIGALTTHHACKGGIISVSSWHLFLSISYLSYMCLRTFGYQVPCIYMIWLPKNIWLKTESWRIWRGKEDWALVLFSS